MYLSHHASCTTQERRVGYRHLFAGIGVCTVKLALHLHYKVKKMADAGLVQSKY